MEQIVDETVPHVMQEVAEVADSPVPQILVQSVEVIIWQEQVSERVVLQIQEHAVEVFKLTPQEPVSERMGKEIVAVAQIIPLGVALDMHQEEGKLSCRCQGPSCENSCVFYCTG